MVCPDTELAVLAAVAQLEYVPEDTARSLPQVGARSFGVAMPAISNVYFREVVDGTEGEAETAPRRWPKRDESETGGGGQCSCWCCTGRLDPVRGGWASP